MSLMAEHVQEAAAPKTSLPNRDTVMAANSSVTGNQQVQMVENALVNAALDSIQAGLRATGGPGLDVLVESQGGANHLPMPNPLPVVNWLVPIHRFLLLPLCMWDHRILLLLFH